MQFILFKFFGYQNLLLALYANYFKTTTDFIFCLNNNSIFGSRAKGNYRDNSDIDLVIKGKNINLSTLQEIENKLEALYIPNTIDLLVYDNIHNADLLNHIHRIGKPFYEKGKSLPLIS